MKKQGHPSHLSIRTRQRELRVRLLLTMIALMVFAAHASGIAQMRVISHLENLAYDTRLRLAMPFSVDENIVIVGVDEPSLAQEGRWPWPRERMGVLVDRLFEQYRVRAVGLDVVFAEPQDGRRVSSAGVRPHSQWRSIGGWLESPVTGRQEATADELLADSLRGRPVATAMLFRDDDDGRSVGVLPEPLMRWEELPKGLEPLESESYTANIPVVSEAAPSGFTDNPLLDPDGHYRRVPLLRSHGGQVYPSFALKMAWLMNDRVPSEPVRVQAGRLSAHSRYAIDVGEAQIPMDDVAAIQVPFRGPRFSFSYVSAGEVFNGTAPSDLLDGKVVLVGRLGVTSGAGLRHPGGPVHAQHRGSGQHPVRSDGRADPVQAGPGRPDRDSDPAAYRRHSDPRLHSFRWLGCPDFRHPGSGRLFAGQHHDLAGIFHGDPLRAGVTLHRDAVRIAPCLYASGGGALPKPAF
jgi:CHASE2 domain-containing sensor protein